MSISMFNNSRVVAVSTGTILRVVAVLMAIAVAWLIRDIILYVFIAFLLAGMLHPFGEWAEKHKIPKGLAVVVLYVVFVSLFALMLVLLVPALVDESKMIATAYGKPTEWLSDLINALKGTTDQYGLTTNLKTGLLGLQGQVQQIFGSLFGAIGGAFNAVAGIVIVFVLSFYIVIEEQAVKKLFRDIVPRNYQEKVSNIVWQMTQKLGEWMRGQLALCLIMGGLYLIAFVSIGVPYPVLLAVFGGLLEFVPYLGPIISGIPAILLALTVSPWHALVTAIVIVVLQQLENNLIVPKVMQKAVGINPIISIVAFLVGAQLFGVLGALFAIPVAAAAIIVWTQVIEPGRKPSA